MESVKKIKAYLDKRFQKHPIAGYMVYGGLMGFIVTYFMGLRNKDEI